MLETKTRAGTVTLEHGVIAQRFADDAATVRSLDFSAQMERTVEDVAAKWEDAGRSAPALRPIVVIWGSFDQGSVTTGDVT